MIFDQHGSLSTKTLIRSLQLYHYTTALPLILYDEHSTLVCQYGDHAFQVNHPTLSDIDQVNKAIILHHEEGYYLAYRLSYRTKTAGHILIGPLLTDRMSDLKLIQLAQSIRPPKTLDLIKDMVEALPRVDIYQLQYFCLLLDHLIKYPPVYHKVHDNGDLPDLHLPLALKAQKVDHHPYDLEKTLHKNLFDPKRKEDVTSALMTFNHYKKPTLCENDPLRSAKNHFICSCTNITRAAIDAGLDSDLAFTISDQLIVAMEKLTSIHEVEHFTNFMRITFQDQQRKYQEETLTPPVIEIMTFVKNHLTEPLRLTDLSHRMGYSDKYLSDLFKKETGQNYRHYVNTQKIELGAKKMLSLGHTIQEVSLQLSFCNPSYFSKVFRQITGMTPYEYVRGLKL